MRKNILGAKKTVNFFIFLALILPLLLFLWTGRGIFKFSKTITEKLGIGISKAEAQCWTTTSPPSDCGRDGGCMTGDSVDCDASDCSCSDCDCSCDW